MLELLDHEFKTTVINMFQYPQDSNIKHKQQAGTGGFVSRRKQKRNGNPCNRKRCKKGLCTHSPPPRHLQRSGPFFLKASSVFAEQKHQFGWIRSSSAKQSLFLWPRLRSAAPELQLSPHRRLCGFIKLCYLENWWEGGFEYKSSTHWSIS